MGKNFSQHVLNVFANHKTTYEQISQLMKDVALGREIYDEATGRVITKSEANEKIHAFSCEVLGITKDMSKKEMRRALRDHGREWFDIIEDTVDEYISVGFDGNEWFNDLVESKNIAYGDRQDFIADKDTVLAIAKMGESHHDHILQRVGKNAPISIPTARYGVKIGEDINKYIIGQTQWTEMVAAIAKAFIKLIQQLVYAEISNLSSKLPAAVVGSGALSSTPAIKQAFDDIIEAVSAANDGADVVIMGTKNALKKITALADVQWAAKEQRDSVAQTGTIGIYEGTRLVEIPQRFSDKSLAATAKLMSDKKLVFLAVGSGDKPIKFIDEGDTEITEVTDKGEAGGRWDDLMSYEVQRRLGVGTVLGRIMGEWTLP